MSTNLPTDIAATYPDQSPGDATHQQHHDQIHQYTNDHDTAVDPHGDRAYADGKFALLGHTHGQVNAQAQDSVLTTTGPSILPTGLSMVRTSPTSGTWPGIGSGSLLTHNHGASYATVQEFVDSTEPPRVFVRRWHAANNSWSVWSEK